MNIFYLDHNPYRAAEMMCDKHVVKMIVETAQILSTVHHRYGTATADMYKPTHQHHPSTVWAGDSLSHYNWLRQHFQALLNEYTSRYGKIHACWRMLGALMPAPRHMPNEKHRFPPQCMPEQYRQDDTVAAYRAYYMAEKARFARWKLGNVPDWWPVAA